MRYNPVKRLKIPDPIFTALLLTAALGSAVIGGVFFAFSTFVMRALAKLPPAEGMAAMQAINIAVINPLFMGAFLGTAVVCIAVIVGAAPQWQSPMMQYALAGALLYLVGSLLVTLVFNVPLNDALAAANATDPASAELWATYLSRWTVWNHVRMFGSIAAAVSYIVALRQ